MIKIIYTHGNFIALVNGTEITRDKELEVVLNRLVLNYLELEKLIQ